MVPFPLCAGRFDPFGNYITEKEGVGDFGRRAILDELEIDKP